MSFLKFQFTRLALVGLLLSTVVLGAMPPPEPSLGIQLLNDDQGRHFIKVTGFQAAEMKVIGEHFDRIDWRDLFPVCVAGKSTPSSRAIPLWGTYAPDDDGIRFVPRFPLRSGLTYRVALDLKRLASLIGLDHEASAPDILNANLEVPAAPPAPRTTLAGIYPSASLLPENLLKFYLEFSGPMSRGEAYQHITLLDGQGDAIELPFLELDEELWDPYAQRLTLFIDPGRIKRGLKPREELGPSLLQGGDYQLVIDSNWRDAQGNALISPGRKSFHVGPPDYLPIDPKTWAITPPAAGSKAPLVVTFPEPLDYGLLQRVLYIEDKDGVRLDGDVRVQNYETQWTFIPASAWREGEWILIVDRVLEDLAGNSVGRAFDVEVVEVADRYDTRRRGEPVRIKFQIRGRN